MFDIHWVTNSGRGEFLGSSAVVSIGMTGPEILQGKIEKLYLI
jgi:hypothetical protein